MQSDLVRLVGPERAVEILGIRLVGLNAENGKKLSNVRLAGTTIPRRQLTDQDVPIKSLFCGICHSDLHCARNEWHEFVPTVYRRDPGDAASAASITSRPMWR